MSVPIILDTDIDTDCDDVGALAVLHALARLGKAHILGVICSIPYPATAACVRVINHYFGQPEIPVGLLSGEELEISLRFKLYREHLRNAIVHGWQRYNEIIAREHEAFLAQLEPPQDAVQLYRKLLAQQPDQSTTIVAIGLLTALQKLMESGPDHISPLNGVELLRSKVAKLVTMGVGTFPHGKDVFNWEMDCEAAAAVLNGWPAPLVVSEWGADILTGASLSQRTPPGNPVRQAYEIYLRDEGRSRSSWDQTALLYGILGPQDNFKEKTGYCIRFDPASGEHQWLVAEQDQPPHIYLEKVASNADMAKTIEDLMTLHGFIETGLTQQRP